MSVPEETASKVRSVLAEHGGTDAGVESILPAEKGVYRGFLILSRDRAFFVRDKFGRLEFDGEFPYMEMENPASKKGFLGWEFQGRFRGALVRFTRLAEEDAASALQQFSSAEKPTPETGETPKERGRPEPDRGAVAESRAPEAVAETDDRKPGPLESPHEEPEFAAVVVEPLPPETEPGQQPGAEEAESPEEDTGPADRSALIRSLSVLPDLSPSGTELHRQISEMEGSCPSAPEAADLLMDFDQAVRSGHAPPDLMVNAFGWKILPPLLVILEDRDQPPRFRRLAAGAIGTFRFKRLIGYLVYHAAREKDPLVARALFEGLAGIGGAAAARCLLKIIAQNRDPYSGIALDVVSESSWVPAVQFLAGEMEHPMDDRSAGLGNACARILRLPPSSALPDGLLPKSRAIDFHNFWKAQRSGAPVPLIKASVEKNLEALQSSNRGLASIAEENLLDLAVEFHLADYVIPGLEGSDELAWIVWWSKNKGKPPETWLAPSYVEALSLPIPRIKMPEEEPGRRKKMGWEKPERRERRPEGTPRKEKRAPGEKPGMTLTEAVLRAGFGGAICGGAWWFFFYGGTGTWSPPFIVKNVLVWAVFAAVGGLVLFRPSWGARLVPWGVVGGIPAFLLTHSEVSTLIVAAQALGWGFIATGFFKMRKAKTPPFLGGVLGMGVFWLYSWIFGPVFVAPGNPFLRVGVFAAVFWFIQFLPETEG